MDESFFTVLVKDSLVEKVNDYDTILPQDIIFEGAMYCHENEQFSFVHKKHLILTKFGLYLINREKSDHQSNKVFVNAIINTVWTKIYFIVNDPENFPQLGFFPYQVSFILNEDVSNFYFTTQASFNEWKFVLEKIGIQTNFDHKYSVGEALGKGATAVVHKISSRSTGQEFACKIFKKKELKSDKRNLKGLINEILILKDIKGHPNLIQIEEVHETKKYIYLVTELIEGSKVFHKKLQYESHEICNIIESLFSALVYLKEMGIVHRDIKPDNLLLKYKDKPLHLNEIKILDFGLATYFARKNHVFNRCGTVGFVAPEILNAPTNSITFTPQVDIFSFGIILYNFITGTRAFREGSTKNMYKNNKNGQVDFSNHNFQKASPQREIKSS
jgi:serine/threonine protein kinase